MRSSRSARASRKSIPPFMACAVLDKKQWDKIIVINTAINRIRNEQTKGDWGQLDKSSFNLVFRTNPSAWFYHPYMNSKNASKRAELRQERAAGMNSLLSQLTMSLAQHTDTIKAWAYAVHARQCKSNHLCNLGFSNWVIISKRRQCAPDRHSFFPCLSHIVAPVRISCFNHMLFSSQNQPLALYSCTLDAYKSMIVKE